MSAVVSIGYSAPASISIYVYICVTHHSWQTLVNWDQIQFQRTWYAAHQRDGENGPSLSARNSTSCTQ